jgi:hypothetical protein
VPAGVRRIRRVGPGPGRILRSCPGPGWAGGTPGWVMRADRVCGSCFLAFWIKGLTGVRTGGRHHSFPRAFPGRRPVQRILCRVLPLSEVYWTFPFAWRGRRPDDPSGLVGFVYGDCKQSMPGPERLQHTLSASFGCGGMVALMKPNANSCLVPCRALREGEGRDVRSAVSAVNPMRLGWQEHAIIFV